MPRYKSVHTGPQIDSGVSRALPGGEIDQLRPNRNLLENWDFRDPVNQRGVTSWSSGYGLDRWSFAGGGSILVNSGSVSLNNAVLTQFFEVGWLKAATYTVSVFADNIYGNAVVGFYGGANYSSGGWISDGNGLFHVTITVTSNDSTYRGFIYIGSTATNITKVKLELGSVSTLANDPPADHEAEKAKCKRYFNLWASEAARTAALLEVGAMRTTPVLSTIDIGGVTYYTAIADL